MCRKGKESASSSALAIDKPSDRADTFASEEGQIQYRKLETKAIHYERKLNILEEFADTIHNRIAYYQWNFMKLDPREINESIVREFYGNLLRRDTETVFLRELQLDTSAQAFEALLQLPHILPSRDAYSKIKADVIKGTILLDTILKKIGRPEACWEYSTGEKVAPIGIACSDLTPEVRIWQQIIIIDDYLLPRTLAIHIRVHLAMLLWAISECKKIAILPLIRESMWKWLAVKLGGLDLGPAPADSPKPAAEEEETTENDDVEPTLDFIAYQPPEHPPPLAEGGYS
ncbi:hypothetical protein AHAS_Ahas14G0126100 [Arachis hypogaea]